MLRLANYTVTTGKPLLVFFLLGPLIGAFSTGEHVLSGLPLALIPVYIVGGVIAILTWILYTLAMDALVPIACRNGFFRRVGAPFFLMVLGIVIGSVMGFAAFNVFTCSNSRWLFGGWVGCLANSLQKFAALTLIPGGVCGGISTLFFIQKNEV